MAHGGARPGTGPKAEPVRRIGRPRKPVTVEEKNKVFDTKAAEALPELFDTLKTIALGYKVATYAKPRKTKADQKFDADNEPVFVYFVPPDKDAVKYLVDRAAGKAVTKSPEAVDTELTLEMIMPEEESDG
jgi:hypothetical protein